MPRRFLLLLFSLFAVLFVSSCDWDAGQFLFHPDVEVRMRQSREMPAPEPPAVDPDSFRFAMFSDLHVGEECAFYLTDYARHADSLGIDFFCVAGDLTHDGYAEEFDTAQAWLDAIGPHYTVPGNHDLYHADGWQEYKSHFGPGCYSIAAGDRLRLLFLDTADGTVGATQFEWLEQQLRLASEACVLVVTHSPLYDGNHPGIARMASTAERAKLQSLLQEHGAFAIVSGHIHGWRHTVVGGVNHFIIGTITDALDYGVPGYLLFTFTRGSLRWEHIPF